MSVPRKALRLVLPAFATLLLLWVLDAEASIRCELDELMGLVESGQVDVEDVTIMAANSVGKWGVGAARMSGGVGRVIDPTFPCRMKDDKWRSCLWTRPKCYVRHWGRTLLEL